MRRAALAVAVASGFALSGAPAQANLLVNGDFETGTFAGWTVVDQAGGSGSWFISAPGSASPLSSFPTAANPSGGAFYAVSDQGGPGTHALLQSFTVAPGSQVMLTFQAFINDQSGAGPLGTGLDYTVSPTQHARIDILSAGALALDTGAGVIANLLDGIDPGAPPNPYRNYAIDITPWVGGGGTFQLRFAETDNQLFFQFGVDNVAINTPEPASLALLGAGLLGLGFARRRGK